MSTIGGPLNTSLIQAAQAQQTASKARDREKAASRRTRDPRDVVDLRVSEVELPEAVRHLPRNDSEEAEDEHRRQHVDTGASDEDRPERPSIDLQA